MFLNYEINHEVSDSIELTEVGDPGGGRRQGDEELLVCQVERHGQLTEDRQPGGSLGHLLPAHRQ